MAAIALVDVLDHFLAPLVLEIDVDVGGLVALLRKEAGEQQPFLHRIDRRHAQQVADQRIGGASPPLAQDRRIEAAGITHDVMHGKEVAGVVLVPDQPKFLVQHGAVSVRQAGGETLARALLHEMLQPALRCPARRHWLVRVFIDQLVEPEIDAGQEVPRRRQRFRAGLEQAGHFRRILEVPLGIGGEAAAGGLDGQAFANAGEDVVQRARLRPVIKGIVRGEERDACRRGQSLQFRQTPRVRSRAGHGGRVQEQP